MQCGQSLSESIIALMSSPNCPGHTTLRSEKMKNCLMVLGKTIPQDAAASIIHPYPTFSGVIYPSFSKNPNKTL